MKRYIVLALMLLAASSEAAVLLTGQTPATHVAPSGWTTKITQDFESGSLPAGQAMGYSNSITTTRPHGSGKSLEGFHWGDDSTVGWFLREGYTGTFDEIYLSFWEYMESQGTINDEMFIAKFFRENPYHEIIIDMFGNKEASNGGFNSSGGKMVIEPQGDPTITYYGPMYVYPKGSWVQWEIHYRKSTPGNSDGFMYIYNNGVLIFGETNKNLNGSRDMNNCQITAGGTYTKLTWVNKPYVEPPTINYSIPEDCATEMGPAGGGDHGPRVTNFANLCPCTVQCPPDGRVPLFRRFFDDVIVMTKTGSTGQALTVTTTTLPGGTAATSYSPQTLTASGGVSPYTWSISAGSLPSGLTLAPGGAISGIPTVSGTSNFTVRALDSVSATATQALSIVVVPGTPGGEVTSQNTNLADTFINSGGYAGTNYGTSTELRVYQWPANTTANRIIVMDNADILSIPSGVTITAAKLKLYLTGYDSGGGNSLMRIYARKISGTLPDTTTVTWTNFAGTLTQLGYTEVGLALGYKEWDITTVVQAAYAASPRTPVYVALDGGAEGVQDTNRIFASVDHATAAWRPQLVVTTQTPINLIPPAAPTGHYVSAGDNQVTLYHGTSSGTTQYNCYWTSNGSTPSKSNGTKIAGIANAYVLTGLTDNVTYKFIFTATNADGESIESSVDIATPIAPPDPPAVPSAPTLHSVGAGNGYVNLFPGTSAGATSYNAYYTTDGTTPTTGSTKITGATGGQRLTATNGTTYKFVFTAVNATGESLVSTVDTAIPTANEGINFLTNTGNYITTIINGLKNYLQ